MGESEKTTRALKLPGSVAAAKRMKPPVALSERYDLPKSFDHVIEAREIPDSAKAAEHAFVKMANQDAERLLSYPNVIGAGIGAKVTKGSVREALSLSILVDKKVPQETLKKGERIPKGWELDGLPSSLETDVLPLSNGKSRQICRRNEPATFDATPTADYPLQGGISLGTRGLQDGGTVTNFWGSANSSFWSTNNHVVQDGISLSTGQTVIQPQVELPATTPHNELGTVDLAYYIVPGILSGALIEHLDAAGGDLDLVVVGGGAPPNVAPNQQCGADQFDRIGISAPGRPIRCSSVTSIVRDGVTIIANGFLTSAALAAFGGFGSFPLPPFVIGQLLGGISIHMLPNDDGDSGGMITSQDGSEALDVLWGGDDGSLTLANSAFSHALWLGVSA